MTACLLLILPQPGDPERYLVLYAGTPLGNPRPGAPRRGPERLLVKAELFHLLRALHLPDAHIIGALTGDVGLDYSSHGKVLIYPSVASMLDHRSVASPAEVRRMCHLEEGHSLACSLLSMRC